MASWTTDAPVTRRGRAPSRDPSTSERSSAGRRRSEVGGSAGGPTVPTEMMLSVILLHSSNNKGGLQKTAWNRAAVCACLSLDALTDKGDNNSVFKRHVYTLSLRIPPTAPRSLIEGLLETRVLVLVLKQEV